MQNAGTGSTRNSADVKRLLNMHFSAVTLSRFDKTAIQNAKMVLILVVLSRDLTKVIHVKVFSGDFRRFQFYTSNVRVCGWVPPSSPNFGEKKLPIPRLRLGQAHGWQIFQKKKIFETFFLHLGFENVLIFF